MARVTISYDNTSIQTSTIVVQEIQHESVDRKEVTVQRLGSNFGGKITNINFAPRVIRITGTIKGTSQSNLESNLDTFKELLNRSEKNLDIGYAGGTRRYVCSMASITLERRNYNLTFLEFEASFIVSNPPFGLAIDTATFSFTTTSTGSYWGGAVFSGSQAPMPIIKVTITSQTAMTELYFRNVNTGDIIRITRTFANSDVVIINPVDMTVTVNGTAVDYDGFFPEFVAKGNDFRAKAIASAVNMTIKLIYYARYL